MALPDVDLGKQQHSEQFSLRTDKETPHRQEGSSNSERGEKAARKKCCGALLLPACLRSGDSAGSLREERLSDVPPPQRPRRAESGQSPVRWPAPPLL